MTHLIEVASGLQHVLDAFGWRFCFIGGVAVQHWGEPRLTRDVDVSLLTGFGREEEFIDPLLAAYPARLTGARAFALQRRVLLLKSPDGIGIDISLAALPFEQRAIERAARIEVLPGLPLHLCSAEDLLISKIFAARPLDLEDARSILVRQGTSKLDLTHVETELSSLADLAEVDLLYTYRKCLASV